MSIDSFDTFDTIAQKALCQSCQIVSIAGFNVMKSITYRLCQLCQLGFQLTQLQVIDFKGKRLCQLCHSLQEDLCWMTRSILWNRETSKRGIHGTS